MSATANPHPFLDDEQWRKLQKFAEIMHIRGGMVNVTQADLIVSMALNGVTQTPIQFGDNESITLFSDPTWAYLVVQFKDGTCGLKVKKDYLLREFAPHGVQDTKRAGKIFGGMLSILGVDPRRVDLDALVRMKK